MFLIQLYNMYYNLSAVEKQFNEEINWIFFLAYQ